VNEGGKVLWSFQESLPGLFSSSSLSVKSILSINERKISGPDEADDRREDG